MARTQPKSLNDQKIGLKSSFDSLFFIPRFFKEIWRTNKTLFLTSAFCRIVAALLPVAILWVGKLIFDAIIQITTHGEKRGEQDSNLRSLHSRFTVCPRWPLEYLPYFLYYQTFTVLSRRRDSNPRPADYKSAALAN